MWTELMREIQLLKWDGEKYSQKISVLNELGNNTSNLHFSKNLKYLFYDNEFLERDYFINNGCSDGIRYSRWK